MTIHTTAEAVEKPPLKRGRTEKPLFAFRRVYTYADCLEWPEDFRAEIIHGDLFVMATPTPKHQRIAHLLAFHLEMFVQNNPEWQVYPAPLDVRFFPKPDNSDVMVFEPDIAVVHKTVPLGKNSVDGVPDMIIEILSPSTAVYDRNVKLPVYENAGVKEFWLVDASAETVEVNVLENGEYTAATYSRNDTVSLSALPGCAITLDRIFDRK